MKYFKILIVVLLICIGCGNISKIDTNDSIDTTSVTTEDDSLYDWTPEEFKQEHYDEWVVVKHAIDQQQNKDGIDYEIIDGFVRNHIDSKSIILPQDTFDQIKMIESICETKFDISEYDTSNMGMHIADGTSRLFDGYINWLLIKEASQVKGTDIDLLKEEDMLNTLMDAFSNCCEYIGYAFQGSGGWHGYAYVSGMQTNLMKSMCTLILHPETHNRPLPYLLTPNHFKEECEVRKANYKEGGEYSTPAQTVNTLLNSYANSITEWLEYRAQVEKRIANPTIKSEYSYITRSFAKEQYIHLKNSFGDVGMVSEFMDECYLHSDCSDEEMLNYNFEKAYNEAFSEYIK